MWSNLWSERCAVIAEVAQNHDGSLGTAHAYIDAVARTGATAIKFQTHIASAESSAHEPWRIQFSPQDATRYDYWKRVEFSEEQWHGLAAHAARKGLLFLSSPFSIEAIELLERIGVPAWKVGAGEITNLPMLERLGQTKKPVILSTGLAAWPDVDVALRCVSQHGSPVAVLQCTTAYPCPPEKLGLNVLAQIRARYGCATGLSDHSGAIYAGLAAASLGADLIEVHVTLSRECFGPDVIASITTSELQQMVEGVRFITTALANPVDKQSLSQDVKDVRTIFGKSVIAARDLIPGQRLAEQDLGLRKPGTGIPASAMKGLLNCTLKRAVAAGAFLAEEDFEH